MNSSTDLSVTPRFPLRPPVTVFGRICTAAAMVGVEAILATFPPHPRPWQIANPLATAAIVFAAALFCLLWPKLKGVETHAPLGRVALRIHALAVVAIVVDLLAYTSTSPVWIGLIGLRVTLWVIALATLAVSGCLLWLPAVEWWNALRRAGVSVLYALGAVVTITLLGNVLEQAWINGSQGFFLQRITLVAVARVLLLVMPGTSFDLATDTISLPHFAATVGTPCSGVEGLALTFLFTSGWLLYMRRELRMPAALLLLPLAMATVYSYNIVRIVVLLLIGNAGHEAIAVGGFHSQAGWIGFNAVALLILVVSSRVRWFMREPAAATARPFASGAAQADVPVRNAAAVYLMPFLGLLAATSLSKAMSAGFEPLYALRLVVVLPLMWRYRQEYRSLQWRVSPVAVAGGAVVFAVWVLGERWFSPPATDAIATGLAGLSPWAREAWIVTRALTTIALVPLAEELAFRGMLMRRLTEAEFDKGAYTATPLWALLVSSLVFGAMHGQRWIVGTVAGLVFGWLARRSGRLPDAILAHMTANALLTLWVLERGQWWFW